MKHFAIFILVLLCFCCCNQPRPVSLLKTYPVEKAMDMESKTVWLDSISDSITVIQLETSDNILIGQYFRVKFHNNLLFVSHNSPGQPFSLSAFDLNGKYLWDIGKRGQGPGEYYVAWNFFFNNDKVYVQDNTNKAFFCYTLDGKFIKKISYLPYPFIDGIAFINRDVMAGLIGYSQGNDNRIVFLNENGICLDSIKYEHSAERSDSGFGAGIFFNYADNQYFNQRWDDTVFYIGKDLKIYPKYVLNKGKYTLSFKDYSEYSEKYQRIKIVHVYFENDQYIILRGETGYTSWFHEYICIEKETDDVNKVCFFYSEETLRYFRKEAEYQNTPFSKDPVFLDDGSPTFGIRGYSTDNTIWIGVEKPLDEEDNPVIVLVHLKSAANFNKH